MLQNKAGLWMSNDEWNFKKKDENDDYSYYIENISKSKVLGAKNDGEVILEDFEEDKAGQIWMKVVSDDEGYSTLSQRWPKMMIFWPFMTAISSNTLKIQGI
jgi:hypothetical protein